jgi:hypothetical protein
MRSLRFVGAILSAAVLAVGGPAVARAEEHTIQATAPWQGRARVYVTGPQQVFVLATFGGRLTVETEQKTLEGAQVLCPAAFDADYVVSTQRGEGRCIITTASGDRLFARWTCTGEPDKGCAGRLVLTGGTGAFQGVAGEGDLALRLVLSGMVQMDRQESEYDLAGVMLLPRLKFRTP